MLLPLSELDFEREIPSWFTVHERRVVAAQFSFANRYGEVLYSENRILAAATAAEALHASQKPELRTDFLSKPAAVKIILDEFPPEEHPLIRTRLKHFNKPSLRNRLKELLEDAGPAMGSLTLRNSAWVALVVDSRNQVVHGEAERPNGPQLLALAETVGHLVELCLLIETGISPGRLAARLGGYSRYKWLLQLRERYLCELLGESSSGEVVR